MKNIKLAALLALFVLTSISVALPDCIPNDSCGGGSIQCDSPNPRNCNGSQLEEVWG
jgi:hypothetical protein